MLSHRSNGETQAPRLPRCQNGASRLERSRGEQPQAAPSYQSIRPSDGELTRPAARPATKLAGPCRLGTGPLVYCLPVPRTSPGRSQLLRVLGASPSGHELQGGDVAQLGERCNRTAEVVGSNPIISTNSLAMYWPSGIAAGSLATASAASDAWVGTASPLLSSRAKRGNPFSLPPITHPERLRETGSTRNYWRGASPLCHPSLRSG